MNLKRNDKELTR